MLENTEWEEFDYDFVELDYSEADLLPRPDLSPCPYTTSRQIEEAVVDAALCSEWD